MQSFGSATLINNDINGNIVGMPLAGIRKFHENGGRPQGSTLRMWTKTYWQIIIYRTINFNIVGAPIGRPPENYA